MKKLFKVLVFTCFSFLVALLGISRFLDYSSINPVNLYHIGNVNNFFGALEVIYFLCFISIIYYYLACFYRQVSFYWDVYAFSSTFLLLLLGFMVMYLLPALLYLNSMMLYTQLYYHHFEELGPWMDVNDFLINFMKSPAQGKEEPIPAFNGHLLVVGEHKGRMYSCLDVARILDGVPGGRLAQWITNTPDVACHNVDSYDSDLNPKTESKAPTKGK